MILADVAAIEVIVRAKEYPLSSKYDPTWVLQLDMGLHPLWQLEDLLPALNLRPEMRVLDLGSGRGATSVFLARECEVRVTACDLWVSADDIQQVLEASGVADVVSAVNADARDLPFGDEEFDAVVSIDAFEYFGTDVHFLPKLLRVLKSGGSIGVSTPGLRTDPYAGGVPSSVSEVVGFEAAAWHSAEWWHRHWELTAMVDEINASWQPRGYENWLLWAEAVREYANDDSEDHVLNMLRQDDGREIGFVLLTARRR